MMFKANNFVHEVRLLWASFFIIFVWTYFPLIVTPFTCNIVCFHISCSIILIFVINWNQSQPKWTALFVFFWNLLNIYIKKKEKIAKQQQSMNNGRKFCKNESKIGKINFEYLSMSEENWRTFTHSFSYPVSTYTHTHLIVIIIIVWAAFDDLLADDKFYSEIMCMHCWSMVLITIHTHTNFYMYIVLQPYYFT